MVSRYLEEGERVLAEHQGLYATDRRLIRIVEGAGGPQVHSLEYGRIRNVSALIQPRLPLVAGGMALALAGALLPIPTPAASLVLGFGMGLVLVGLLRRRSFFVFNVPDLPRSERALWRLEGVRDEGARAVVRVVLEKIREQRQEQSPREGGGQG